MKNSKLKFADIFLLLIGCLLMSISINMFFDPHDIAPGGLTGVSILVSTLTGIPIWLINISVDIPLFLFAYRILSKKDSLKTVLGIIFLTTSLKITENFSNIHITDDVLLSAIAGGIVVGISLGMLFRVDASTGGSELACLILNKIFPFISISTFLFIIDGIVIILAGIVSRNIETALYATISLYITIKISDTIVEGFDFSKSFIIVTDKFDELSKAIMKDLERGVTFLEGRGGYTNIKKDVLLVVVSRREEVHLKKLVNEIDPMAFIIINDAHEVLGEGFSKK